VADIVISYKREEQDTARALADSLVAKGWSVWWDPKLRAGERYDRAIQDAIKAAKCVIVLWSELSVNSDPVQDEASLANDLKKLVPVAIEKADLPMPFRRLHTVQMHGWKGSSDTPGFRELVEQLQSKIGGGTLAAAAAATSAPSADSLIGGSGVNRHFSTMGALLGAKLPRTPWKVLTPADVDSDESSLLRLHATLMKDRETSKKDLPKINVRRTPKHLSLNLSPMRYSLLDSEIPPVGHSPLGLDVPLSDEERGPTYGILSRIDLESRPHDEKLEREAREVLETLTAAGGDAIDYKPAQLRDLSPNLQACGFHLLLFLPERVLAKPGRLEITQATLDWYTAQHKTVLFGGSSIEPFPDWPMPFVRAWELQELANRLGLHLEPL
jgi:hypothetical protein